MRRIALFGGSFNPPHVGHVLVVAWVLATDQADEVWLIPTAHHPFGKDLAPFADRAAMAQAAVAPLGSRVKVDLVEGEREGPSYTIDTVELLRKRHPDCRFSLVVGTDILHDGPKWKEWDRLRTLVDLLVVRRGGVPGSEVDDGTPLFPVLSASAVRARIAKGEPIDRLVPSGVRAILQSRRLYRQGVD